MLPNCQTIQFDPKFFERHTSHIIANVGKITESILVGPFRIPVALVKNNLRMYKGTHFQS